MRNTCSFIWQTLAWLLCSKWLLIFCLKFKIRRSSLSSPFIWEICKAGLTQVGSTSIGITIGKVSSGHETSISSRNWSSSCQKKERHWVTKIDLQVSSWEENWCYCQLQIQRKTLFRGVVFFLTHVPASTSSCEASLGRDPAMAEGSRGVGAKTVCHGSSWWLPSWIQH